MSRAQNPNLDILIKAVDQLGELADELVFLGGCATGLLITDRAAPPIRVTRDVDALVQVLAISEYREVEKKLRVRGFKEDLSIDAPICRWRNEDIMLDIMPSNEGVLGFGSRWYAPAWQNAVSIQLPNGRWVRLVSAPYFLITKLDAFESRGHGDFLMSHDVEDIVAVIDGRPELFDEVLKAGDELKTELALRFGELIKNVRFTDAVSGHLPSGAGMSEVTKVLNIIRRLSLK